MGGRKHYRRKGLGKEIYAILVIIIFAVNRNTIMFIYKKQIIICIALAVFGVTLKLYLDYHNRIKEKQRKQEYLRTYRSINHLLNKFKNNPTAFEGYVASIFDCLGYKTEVTKATNDGGKDIVMSKDGIKYIVEVKLYSENNKIGREKIQKLQGAMLDSNADKGIFVTTSTFTKEAFEYGHKHDISLINGKKLVKLIEKALDKKESSSTRDDGNPITMIQKLLE